MVIDYLIEGRAGRVRDWGSDFMFAMGKSTPSVHLEDQR